MTNENEPRSRARPKRRAVRAVGPRLKKLLFVVFGLFAVLGVNSLYLASVTLLEQSTGDVYQNWFYLYMFLLHLILGLAIVLPVIAFGIAHIKNTYDRPNRRAVYVGYALFTCALALLFSGFVLVRLEGIIVIKNPLARSVAYWTHVLTPLLVVWLFVLHRLAGRRIRWRVGLAWGAAAAVFALVLLVVQAQDPRKFNVEGNPEGEKYFFPSLARTASGDFIPADTLMNDQYCLECHADVHESWMNSVHRFSSFNNPPYLFSVRNTRAAMLERDGDIRGSRFCAGCHDPVPFFSGRFNDPNYDDVNDPTAHAGITCTVCHSITHINSVRGNADYTIDVPVHYPFATSGNSLLGWTNRQLIKAKPEFHKKTFLKPLHKTTEFCGSCHKVHLPEELNDYKWLRGQNHYDAFLLSGVSGHGITSFYYPPKAQQNCNGCHMQLVESEDFGAKLNDDSGKLTVHDHMFPSANTAIPTMVDMPDPAGAIAAHQAFLKDSLRVDIFGIRNGDQIDDELLAPLRPEVPTLRRGRSYLVETVLRTLTLGHLFTQGTADSNEVWVEVEVTSGGRTIGTSGGMDEDGGVDPWSHFVNAFVLDRDGRRIDRRNAEDIFIALYNHQIPPGAADVLHYKLDVPRDASGPVTVDVKLKYRKFDTIYMKAIFGDDYVNRLPVTTIAHDRVTFPVAGVAGEGEPSLDNEIPPWQRWNDYGIGLLRKPGQGQLLQAEAAFQKVEELGRPDGPLNLARVYLREGRVAREAPAALRRAAEFDPPARAWTVLWLSGLVNKQNGQLQQSIEDFNQILDGGFEQAVGRNFDFSRDYRLLNELGDSLFRYARQFRGDARKAQREELLRQAVEVFHRALVQDPENVRAHYSLRQVYADLGETELERQHGELHAKYKPDDNASDQAIAAARRRYPAANHAAEAVVIYDLHRPGAFGLRTVQEMAHLER